MRLGLKVVERKLKVLISELSDFCVSNKSVPTLGFTHYQPAQLVTVGKRASLWLQDFCFDLQRVSREIADLPLRGVKGTTGTHASFLELFNGDSSKVKQLDALVVQKLGFNNSIGVSGQTYTRKLDFYVMARLSEIAQSAHKMATDIRLLANMKEIEEPFEKSQIGSSAMAYKRNPMRSERMCSLARFVRKLLSNPAQTHAVQWLERTLDDSANRRIVIPEAFLAVDAILTVATNVVDGLVVYPKVIRRNVMRELPFMATENVLMACVKEGGDRQELHELIREHSMEAGKQVKVYGLENDLLTRIKNDPAFACVHEKLDELTDPANFVGRSAEQVDEIVEELVKPLLKGFDAKKAKGNVELRV